MMNNTETALILAKISTYDNRKVTREMVVSWQEAMKPWVIIGDAKQAVIDFYADPDWAEDRLWIMPADINARCKVIREAFARQVDESLLLRPYREQVGCAYDYARRLIPHGLMDGKTPEESVAWAVGLAQRKAMEIEETKRLTKLASGPKPVKHHFIDNIKTAKLADVIGREPTDVR